MDNIYYQTNNGGSAYQLASKVQKWGVLWKKPFGPTTSSKQTASKWSKRFFVVKEGFLLYYPESEKRDFDKRRFFNIHPKGVIPLGGSIVEPVNEPSRSFGIKIDHEDINGAIVIATESEVDREKWIDILRRSGRITWKNAELGESMIQTLEKQSLQLAKDSQRYRDQLHEGAQALREEMDKSEELEKIAVELENEKKKIEETANELLTEKARTQSEFQETLDALKTVEAERESLSETSYKFKETLQLLEKEKEETLTNLRSKEEETKKLADQNMSLSDTTSALKEDLEKIEQRRKDLESDLSNIQISLKEKELETQALEEEKIVYSEQAKQLESSLQDLAVQKEMTDQELKEEILARRDAERRLKKAEESLATLEAALKEKGDLDLQTRQELQKANEVASLENDTKDKNTLERMRTSSTIDEEINNSVADLKRFFEDIALEAAIDANKPIIMKNAVHARKSFIRKTKSFKLRKDRDLRQRHSIAVFGHLSDEESATSPSGHDVGSRHSLPLPNSTWVSDQKDPGDKKRVSFDFPQTTPLLPSIPESPKSKNETEVSNKPRSVPDKQNADIQNNGRACHHDDGSADVSESEDGDGKTRTASGSSISDEEKDYV